MSYTPQEQLSIISADGINSDTVISGGNWVGDTYTGAGELNNYAYVGVNLQVDEAGTLFFDFSQDGTNWSTYPVAGFAVASGINEVHTAWKGGRYMRPRFVGTGGRSFFRLQTYYSNLPLPLSAPLNQGIGDDQDATVVRSVGIGQDPTGTYVNQKVDGVAFKTTANLNSGATYDSGVIDTKNFNQVQTQIVADQDGTLEFIFGNSSTMTGNTVGVGGVDRVVILTYESVKGFESFSAPTFTDYVRYKFTNNGASATTHFFFDTKLLTKALSGQVLSSTAPIAPSMVANLGRNILVGQEPDGTFTNQRQDGEAFKTTTPLASGGTFTSDLFFLHGFSQIETRVYSDVPGTLVGRWYDDTSKTQLLRTFTRPYAGDELGTISYFSAPVFGDYLEYEYTNGDVAQSNFDLELHVRTKPISGQILGMNDFIPDGVVANLGRNVIVGQDKAGNFKNVGIDTKGDLNVAVMNPQTAFGELRISEMTPVIQVTYPYNINPLLVNTTTVNGASVTQADNMANLTTSGVTSSSVELSTVNVAKYRAGEGIAARFTALFTTGATTSDSHQIIGIGDSNDGYFFGYSGNTFGIHHRINSGTTFYAQSVWNLDTMDGASDLGNPSGVLLDTTKGNVFEVQYQWLGFGAIQFSVENPITGKYSPVHQIRYANSATVPSSYNPTFPIHCEVNNGTSTDVLTMKSASMSAFVEGKNIPTGPLESASGSNSGGNNGEVLALRNVSVFPSGTTQTNKVVAFLRDLSISNDGGNNTIVRVQLIEDAEYSVSPTYTYIDPNNSIIEVGVGGTYTAGTGKVIATFGVTEVGNVVAELTSRGIAIRPGKTLSFITQGDNSTATIVDISWVEDF